MSKKWHDFSIIKNADEKYYESCRVSNGPDYRLVILRSMIGYFCDKNNDSWDESMARDCLQSLALYLQYLNIVKDCYHVSGFFEIFPFERKVGGQKGALVVDKSDSIFPLVLYPASQSDMDRVKAFKMSAIEVFEYFDKYYPLLEKHSPSEMVFDWHYIKEPLLLSNLSPSKLTNSKIKCSMLRYKGSIRQEDLEYLDGKYPLSYDVCKRVLGFGILQSA